MKEMIAVWFSSGAASAVAAKKTIERYGKSHVVRVINNPVVEEDDDNVRFLRDVEQWLGVTIEFAMNKKYPHNSAVAVWDKRKFMSGPLGAPCTLELKKEARRQWEAEHKPDWHVLGFTADEKKRHDRFVLTERSNLLPVLIDAKITKGMCFDILKSAGIRIPRVYGWGYPNANCIGCVKATSPTYWNHVRKMNPEVFEARAVQSRRLGARLARYKDKRVFLDELPATAKGRPMKGMNFECGIFCEEKS
jgi:hypothetical protein